MLSTAFLYVLPCLAVAGTDADPAIHAGREALDRWWGYPWYDATTDGVRRVEVRPPWSSDWDWPWSDWNLPGFDGVFQWVAWITLLAMFAVVAYLLIRTYLNRRRIGRPAIGDDEVEAADRRRRIESLPFPLQAARLDLLAEARQRYERGDYGEAVKYLFSYELVELDRHRIIRLARGKTNRQYLREIGARRLLGATVERTMVAFEDFFFGGRVIDRARFEACWSQLPAFATQLAEGAA